MTGERKKFLLASVAVSALVGISFFFLPIKENFWTFDYQLFLAAMLLVPPVLVYKRSNIVRAVFLIAALGYFGFLQTACPRPVGAIELIALHLFDKAPILMHVIKVGVLVGITAIFARFYCGWICPKGAVQELIYYKRLKFRMPPKIDRILKFGKYITLVLLIASPLIWHYRLFRAIGPFKVLFNLDGETALIVFFVFVLLVSVFVERAYCRYFCPVGGLLAILSMISPAKVRTRESECISCGVCYNVCPTDAITWNRKEPVKIDSRECILCTECITSCPKNGLYFGFKEDSEQTLKRAKEAVQ